jgi:hypothetical protein
MNTEKPLHRKIQGFFIGRDFDSSSLLAISNVCASIPHQRLTRPHKEIT